MSKTKPTEDGGSPIVMRWSLDGAASEFDIDRRTLDKKLKQNGAIGGSDHKFSTAEICAAVFGDLRFEKLRGAKEDADRKALENARTTGALIENTFVEKKLMDVFVILRQKILGFPTLTDEEKNDLLNELRSVKP